MLKAPWTHEQTNAINAYQALGYVHEFTCPGENGHPADKPRKLVATTTTLFCPWCSYRQDWVHEHMADASLHPQNPIDLLKNRS